MEITKQSEHYNIIFANVEFKWQSWCSLLNYRRLYTACVLNKVVTEKIVMILL